MPSTTATTTTSSSGSSRHRQASNDLVNYIQTENQNNQVVIWSKSYCPYCQRTKQLFQALSKQYNNLHIQIHELDMEHNGAAIQRVLFQLTQQRTVPNVFINNQHIGGNDDVQAAYRSGNLLKLLQREESAETASEEKKEKEQSVATNTLLSLIEKENNNHQVVVWAKSWCPYCRSSKDLFRTASQLENVDVVIHDIDKLPNEEALQNELLELTGQRTVPSIFVNGKHLGGNSDLQKAFRTGQLERLLQAKQ